MAEKNKKFIVAKKNCLEKADLSLKGSVDSKIVLLVNLLNNVDQYYTTSSCSGRIVVFVSNSSEHVKKSKGCKWIFASHDLVQSKDIVEAMKDHTGSAVFKFEPFILHVRCASLSDAQKLHTICIDSNFRNSGLTVGKGGRVTLAVRSTLSLEVPLSESGKMLVSEEYVDYIVKLANEKMEQNWKTTERFFKEITARILEL